MEKENEVLDYLKAMDERLNNRLSEIEGRLGTNEKVSSSNSKDIENIYSILSKLVKDQSAVLKQHGEQYALDSKKVSEALETNGYSRTKALRDLSVNGFVEHYGDEFTKSVRINGGYKRAVVINIYNK